MPRRLAASTTILLACVLPGPALAAEKIHLRAGSAVDAAGR